MKVYVVEPYKGAARCTEKDVKDVAVWFEEAEVGDEIIVRVEEMTQEQYDNLPEYMGT